MHILYLLSYVSLLFQVCFITISIAAGLYYLAELVEEYSKIAKKVISYIIFITILMYLALLFELPWMMCLFGILAQFVHVAIITNFPYVQFVSPSFLGALALLITNHYLAFIHFQEHYFPFSEVLAYFTLCLWCVPFALFISLSANDNVLPLNERSPLLANDVVTNYFSKNRKSGLLSLFSYVKETLLPQRNKKSF